MDGQGHAHALPRAAPDLPIHRVDAGRVDPHQNLADLRIWTIDVGELHDAVVAVSIDNYRFHHCSLPMRVPPGDHAGQLNAATV